MGWDHSTSKLPGKKSVSGWLASAPSETVQEFLRDLDDRTLAALPYLFELWAFEHQLPPESDWTTWVILGGRGAGKTRAGTEWVRAMVEGACPDTPGRARRVALVGETYDQALSVMIRGDSGILACSPPDRRPRWLAGERRLIWSNGAEAQVFSANDPEALRGPQFDAAWADELAKWPNAQKTWDMLQFALRLGDRPQQVVTTTPRNEPALKELLIRPSTVSTHAATEANAAHLAPSFLQEVRARYGNTRLGRQELDGVLLDDVEDGLWSRDEIDAMRIETAADIDRVIVAVDPPVTGHAGSDACGIVVVGISERGSARDWTASILADRSVEAKSPLAWAEAAIAAYRHFDADRLVAEVNQGGEMVEAVIRQIDPSVNYKAVHATRGKAARAEPVALLYEREKVHHVGAMPELEDEMCLMTLSGYEGPGSPDRLDALVWALTEGLVLPAKRAQAPQIRQL